MKIGDTVEWTSQAGGYSKTKRGVIVAVVRANQSPMCVGTFRGLDVSGMPRPHESYIVRTGPRGGFYWPRVSQLRLAAEAV